MSKTQIVLATGEVYDVEDKGERRILIPVGYIKQEEEKHEQSDFDGTFNTGSAGEIHTGTGSDGDCKIYACGRSKGQKTGKVSKMLTFLLALLLEKVRNLWKSMCIRERRLY